MNVTFVNVTNATPYSRKRAREGVEVFKHLGYEAHEGKLLGYRKGEFRYPAEQRARAFNEAVGKSDVIGCTNGGFFAIEMLDGIDYQLLKRKPVVIFGFSDIANLLYATWSKSKTRGIYVSPHSWNSDIMRRTFKDLKENNPINIDYSKRFSFIKQGKSKALFIPGSDLCLYNMFNSEYSFTNRGKIIFLESHYHNTVQDFLWWVIVAKNKGFFNGISGLVIGPQNFKTKQRYNSSKVLTREVLQIFKKDKFPIAITKKLSAHYDFVLPFGGNCQMDSKKGDIQITF